MNWLVVLKSWNVGLWQFFFLEASFFLAICHWQPGWPDFLYFDLRGGLIGSKSEEPARPSGGGTKATQSASGGGTLPDEVSLILTKQWGLCRNKEQATLTISFAPDQLLPCPEREPRKMPFLRALRSKF